MKTNTGLVEYAKAQLGKPYWYGTYGKAISKSLYDSKKKQYPSHYKWSYDAKLEGIKAHDCIGLVKGYLWGNSPTDTKPKYNSAQDYSANSMCKRCEISGKINSIPEVAGVLVFFDGHTGIYEGNGYVIEARGHAYGVVRTKLKSRPWKTWGYCPFIDYGEAAAQQTRPTVKEWQQAAIADGFKFPEYGADGIWGRECEDVARKAIVKRRLTYKYRNLTALLQRFLGVAVDGKCGKHTAAAIKAFQAANGLEADGQCGLMTWRKILT
jgi:hypothetical protein